MHKKTNREAETSTNEQKDKQRGRKKRDRHTYRHAYRQIERQTHRQTAKFMFIHYVSARKLVSWSRKAYCVGVTKSIKLLAEA